MCIKGVKFRNLVISSNEVIANYPIEYTVNFGVFAQITELIVIKVHNEVLGFKV